MKASDLMISDWVLWKNKPVQVVRVSGIRYEFGHYDVLLAYCNNMGDGIESHDISSISPIPLTADLLKKNGWKRDTDKEWKFNNSHILPNYVYQWEKGNMKIEMEANRKGFTISNIIGYRFYAVHELQHLLRICGLTELADNFKI